MQHDNHATRIRRELLIHLAALLRKGDLGEALDRLPLTLRPRGYKGERVRCCLHTERAILRYRLMAMLGFCIEDEQDEMKPLSAYAREALGRRRRDRRLLTVIDDACSACLRSAYFVSNACRGCMARPCELNCPKEAVRVERGQSVIDPAACVACGKCESLCPFHAIVRVPVPCEEACPVDAIVRGKGGKQVIDHERCIACGRCLQACPFGAVAEPSELVDVLAGLKAGTPMVALVAPSLAGQFEATPARLAGALQVLGFRAVLEVAAGADLTAAQEAHELQEKLEAGEPFMTTSCCPAYRSLAKRHLPALAPRVSGTPTPLWFTSMEADRLFPGYRKVFLSPCMAKRQEVMEEGTAHHVLTYEELGAAFVAWGIEVADCPEVPADLAGSGHGWGFAATGGVGAAVRAHLSGEDPGHAVLAGLDKENLRQLRMAAAGRPQAKFLECMACAEGCLGGPGTLTPPKVGRRRIQAHQSRLQD